MGAFVDTSGGSPFSDDASLFCPVVEINNVDVGVVGKGIVIPVVDVEGSGVVVVSSWVVVVVAIVVVVVISGQGMLEHFTLMVAFLSLGWTEIDTIEWTCVTNAINYSKYDAIKV